MLPPDYLEHCADRAVALYELLNHDITNDICRRIVKTGRVTETAAWQAVKAQESGAVYIDIVNRVAKSRNVTTAEVKRMFEEAGVTAYSYDTKALREAGMKVAGGLSPAMENVLRANMTRTNDTLYNLSMTTAANGNTLFVNTMDEAIMMVESGAFSYDEALRYAVEKVGKEGAVVTYGSGMRTSLEAAARANLMTGVNQTAAEITMMNCEDLGAEYVETSAHMGARLEHTYWQGQVFKMEGADEHYDNFYEATEYGEVTGLCGVNCRHSFYPFFPDISKPAYTDEDRDRYVSGSYEWNGKEMNQYEASQYMRRIERSIRESKRRISADKASIAALEDPDAKRTLQDLLRHDKDVYNQRRDRWTQFSDATGLKKEYSRTRVAGQSRTSVAQMPEV